MPNQVPLWVTLVLAVIAIMGPIGGALIGGTITARRDDQRWQRELEREEARWQREQEREEARWQREQEREEARRRHEAERDNHRYWLELRATTYSDVIEYWRRLIDAGGDIVASLKSAVPKGASPDLDEDARALDVATNDLEGALARSEIYSTREMQFLSVSSALSIAQFGTAIAETRTALIEGTDASEHLVKLIEKYDDIHEKNREFANAIKSQLGIPDGPWD